MRQGTGKSPDVIVVGAGIAGAATAYYLATAGYSVELIETVRPGFGASGRNPGFLWLQTKSAGTQMQFALAGRRFAETMHEELGGFGFRASGGMITFRDESVEPVARAFTEDRKRAGLPVELLDGPAARSACPALGENVRGAVWNPLDAHQDTRRLVRVLVETGERRGLGIRLGSAVERLVVKGGRCRGVELADGERIEATATVVAAGPGSPKLLESVGLRLASSLYKFEAAETAPAPFSIGPVLCGQALFRFFDAGANVPRHAIERALPELGFTEQAAQYPDGRVQFGCAFVTGSLDDRPTVAGQALAGAVLLQSLPGLARLPIERTWAGIVLQPPDGMPVIGPAPGLEGLWLNLGHFFGNLAGALSGRLIADLLQGVAPVVAPAPVAPARPGLFA